MGTIPERVRTASRTSRRRARTIGGSILAPFLSALLWSLFWTSACAAQCPEEELANSSKPVEPKSASGLSQSDTQVSAKDKPPQVGVAAEPHISWKRLPRNLLADQKAIWSSPAHLKRGDAKFLLPFAAITAGLVASDRHVAHALANSPPGNGYAFSKRASQAGSLPVALGVAGAFYGLGKWRGNRHAAETGILATEALINAVGVVELLKTATRRERPTTADGQVMLNDAGGQFGVGGRAFPSGHAAHSWALASVIAHRYPRRWAIVLPSYGLAGLVSVSRVTGRRHFPSDVLVGAAIGYFIGRHVVQRHSADPTLGAKYHRVRIRFFPATQSGSFGNSYTATLRFEF